MTALYVLGAVLVLLLAGVVLAPLFEREPPDRELDELPPDERREAAVEALSELEFEYRTDKLPEEEYRRLRTHYGRIALEAEEQMEGGAGQRADDGAASGEGPAAPASAGAGAEAGEPAAGERPGSPGAACPECGADVPDGARFCPGCGRRVEEPEETD